MIIDGHRESTGQEDGGAHALSVRTHVHRQLQVPQAASHQEVESQLAGHLSGDAIAQAQEGEWEIGQYEVPQGQQEYRTRLR